MSLNHLVIGDELHQFDLRGIPNLVADKTLTAFGYDNSCDVKPDNDPGVIIFYKLSSSYYIFLVVTFAGKIYTRYMYNGQSAGWIQV